MGYHRAGFDVVGVDIEPQPNYPFEFIREDALEFLGDREWRYPTELLGFDAIHASPPCQAYPTRELLEQTGLPWVIENVPGAPMRPDIVICGCQVGLELRRLRWFETSWHDFEFASPHHHDGPVVSVVGHGTPSWVREQLGYNPSIADYRAAMGIDWMNRNELSQAIPPAYTELVGERLMAHLTSSPTQEQVA